jgi:hypothetical protein
MREEGNGRDRRDKEILDFGLQSSTLLSQLCFDPDHLCPSLPFLSFIVISAILSALY